MFFVFLEKNPNIDLLFDALVAVQRCLLLDRVIAENVASGCDDFRQRSLLNEFCIIVFTSFSPSTIKFSLKFSIKTSN